MLTEPNVVKFPATIRKQRFVFAVFGLAESVTLV